eukprot:scaffold10816_cov63-Phaeocystis_antarctica.AAC.2
MCTAAASASSRAVTAGVRARAGQPARLLVLGNARSACLGTEHPQKPLGRRANFPGPARRMYADTPRNASDGS